MGNTKSSRSARRRNNRNAIRAKIEVFEENRLNETIERMNNHLQSQTIDKDFKLPPELSALNQELNGNNTTDKMEEEDEDQMSEEEVEETEDKPKSKKPNISLEDVDEMGKKKKKVPKKKALFKHRHQKKKPKKEYGKHRHPIV